MMYIRFLNKERLIEYTVTSQSRLFKLVEVTAIRNADTGRRCRRLEHAVATLPQLHMDLIDAIQWEDPDLLMEVNV